MKVARNLSDYATYLLAAAWALVLAFTVFLAVDAFIAKCGGDSCLFIYVAQGILQGEIPYLDRWDNKGPLLYLLHAIGLLINAEWGIWAMQGVFLAGAIWAAFTVLRMLFGWIPALFALAVLLVYLSRFAPPGNYTEQFGLLFQFLTLNLFIRSEEAGSERSRSRFTLLHVGIGALGAGSFLLRPNLIALWIVIGIYWLVKRDSSLRKLVAAVVGGGSILLIVASLFVSLGALQALWDAVFVFNFAHSDASMLERLTVVGNLAVSLLPITIFVAIAWFLGLLLLLRGRLQAQRFGPMVLVAIVLFPLELLSLSLSGYGFMHYYIAALPTTAILIALLVWFSIEQLRIAPLFASAALLLGAAVLSLSQASLADVMEKYTGEGNVLENRRPTLSDHHLRLRDSIWRATGPDDPILVWGKATWVYLDSDREAPTRFFYEVPLTKPHYTTQAIHAEFLSDVKRDMPKLIVELRDSRVPPLARSARVDWAPKHRFAHDLADFAPFFNLVEEHYLAIGARHPFTIFARRDTRIDIRPPVEAELLVQSTYAVYLSGLTLTFVKEQCADDDATKRFILHVEPRDRSVIGGNAQATLDFAFSEGTNWQVGSGCSVAVQLPEYPIARVRIGQYNLSGTGHDWLEEYSFIGPR